MLDQMSGGRVECGVGRGVYGREAIHMNLDANLVDMHTNQLKQIGLTPRPLQQPHPPLWQVINGHRSIDWAGRNGLNAIMWIPTVKALKERFEVYQKARSEAANFPGVEHDKVMNSFKLFTNKVMPHFSGLNTTAKAS